MKLLPSESPSKGSPKAGPALATGPEDFAAGTDGCLSFLGFKGGDNTAAEEAADTEEEEEAVAADRRTGNLSQQEEQRRAADHLRERL